MVSVRAAWPVFATLLLGCESIAGIRDVTLAESTDGGPDALVDDADALVDDADALADAAEDADDKCASARGPKMVEIPLDGGGSFCIDETEVTEGQYGAFLLSTPDPKSLPPRCAGASFAPPEAWMNSGDGFPRTYVSWCQAHAFCQWAGKRLCGEIGTGGPYSGVDRSEWSWACSQGGKTLFPYGSSFDESRCITGLPDGGRVEPSPVQSAPACHGDAPPYDRLFDMSGNLIEWVNDCVDEDGGKTECAVRGGYFGDRDADAACTARYLRDPAELALGVGFRCCK